MHENGAQRALGHIVGVVGDSSVAVRYGIAPDFVRAARLTVELQTQFL